jgi:GNAT superfamily N-acetyltransferase
VSRTRLATAPDVDTLVSLAVAFRDHLRQPAPSEHELRISFGRLLEDPSTEFLLAEDPDGTALGYVQMRYRHSAWASGLEVELEDVFVAGPARRRGVGRRLVVAALAQARRRGCRQAGVATNERNAAALALYAGLGFRAERARWDGGRQLWLDRSLVRE